MGVQREWTPQRVSSCVPCVPRFDLLPMISLSKCDHRNENFVACVCLCHFTATSRLPSSSFSFSSSFFSFSFHLSFPFLIFVPNTPLSPLPYYHQHHHHHKHFILWKGVSSVPSLSVVFPQIADPIWKPQLTVESKPSICDIITRHSHQ